MASKVSGSQQIRFNNEGKDKIDAPKDKFVHRLGGYHVVLFDESVGNSQLRSTTQMGAASERTQGKTQLGRNFTNAGKQQFGPGQKHRPDPVPYPNTKPRMVLPLVPKTRRWMFVQHPKFPQYHDPPHLSRIKNDLVKEAGYSKEEY